MKKIFYKKVLGRTYQSKIILVIIKLKNSKVNIKIKMMNNLTKIYKIKMIKTNL